MSFPAPQNIEKALEEGALVRRQDPRIGVCTGFQKGDRRLGIEGYESSKWVVQDYGDVVIHVFDPDTRDYYKLEELWADAPKVDWEHEE